MAKPSEQKGEWDASGPKVGTLLQASRQRLGEELADVALMLRIRLPYLVAIEAGQHQELPGATYAVGFIRTYAEHLGLDSEEVVRRFKAEAADGGDDDRKLSFPTPVPETGIPGGAYVFVGLVIAVLGYGTWYLSTTKDDIFTELVSPTDEQMATTVSDDVSIMPEKSETERGSNVTQADALLATLEIAPVLSDDKLVKSEKSEAERGLEAGQADVIASTDEASSLASEDTPSEIAPEESVEAIVSVVVSSSELNPSSGVSIGELNPAAVIEPKVKKLSKFEIKKINVKKPESVFVSPVKPEKTISDSKKPSEAVAEVQPSPKIEPKLRPKKVNREVVASVALETETKIALPELSAELEATETLAPIETAARGSSRININAINNSWIQIRDNNSNTMLVTRLLAAGDSYIVPDQPGLVLLTGNAGALEIVVDGTVVPSIGGLGVVRRGVVLDVDRLKAGAAVSN